jgi:hypothetical protein
MKKERWFSGDHKETTLDQIFIDIRNHSDLVQMGKLKEKKDGWSLNRYSDNRVWYWSPQKLM